MKKILLTISIFMISLTAANGNEDSFIGRKVDITIHDKVISIVSCNDLKPYALKHEKIQSIKTLLNTNEEEAFKEESSKCMVDIQMLNEHYSPQEIENKSLQYYLSVVPESSVSTPKGQEFSSELPISKTLKQITIKNENVVIPSDELTVKIRAIAQYKSINGKNIQLVRVTSKVTDGTWTASKLYLLDINTNTISKL